MGLVWLVAASLMGGEADGRVIVAFGDSITYGANLKPEQSYPAQLQGLLRERLGDETLTVVNAGVGGNTVAAGQARLERDVLAHRPVAVLIGFGLNDSAMKGPNQPKVAADAFAEKLEAVCRKVGETGARVFLATITPVVETWYFERHPPEWYPDGLKPLLARYDAAIRAVAEKLALTVLDLGAVVPVEHIRVPDNSHGSRDGVHPTPDGCRDIAVAYADRLVPWLKER